MQISEWTTTILQDLCNIEYGKAPSDARVEFSEYPLYGTSGVTGYADKPLFQAPLIMVGRKGTINKPIFIEHDCWIIDTAYGLFTENADLKWLFYFISNYDLSRLNEATGVPSLNRNNLYNIEVPVPPLTEQRKIADILTTVDNAISKTEAIIEQTERVKKGLMQQLLTKGIGHLKFKQTDFGEIPENWGVCLLDEVALRKSGHTPDKKKSNYWSGDIPWISLKDTSRLDNRFIDETTDYTTTDGINNSSAVLLPEGTVVISRDATVGKSGIMRYPMATSQHFINYICGDRLFNWYLYYDLQYRKQLFERIAVGSTIKTIGLQFFKELKVAVPPIEEQKHISQILNSMDDKIDKEILKLSKIQTLKKGLMQVLLTGKVRVKVDDPEAVNT
ncbi:type I restriction enzyme S subunit [Paenibacillus cellulosilyticus]|uniref:Type I restriction enzyme S subunit n=1 Tax=Paenibacillus cellulosilyticus TaxID=375489 RepID=A0A2V2YR80_9BACL|nr:restriction endonuclease subunit S [Paenibacillus cellulosilyticus]PWV97398.1 type I restriction enzyme S subunit [Paenibacillus cellulosilyticus]QKS48561.1 restriction endonuclease subunit S [Paenibacillus cellulosilyticus]